MLIKVGSRAAFQLQLAQLVDDASCVTIEHVTPSIDSEFNLVAECSNCSEPQKELLELALGKRKRLAAAIQAALANKLELGISKLLTANRLMVYKSQEGDK